MTAEYTLTQVKTACPNLYKVCEELAMDNNCRLDHSVKLPFTAEQFRLAEAKLAPLADSKVGDIITGRDVMAQFKEGRKDCPDTLCADCDNVNCDGHEWLQSLSWDWCKEQNLLEFLGLGGEATMGDALDAKLGNHIGDILNHVFNWALEGYMAGSWTEVD